ncbi:hypothetical protein V6N11_003538 [Hibiscus sabdariffa]|uniref:Uncharacterized protein n=1 Tax=Hibiscus sabdariffa TaxID=183260 RepID=A0ABR2SEH9_9ROSI
MLLKELDRTEEGATMAGGFNVCSCCSLLGCRSCSRREVIKHGAIEADKLYASACHLLVISLSWRNFLFVTLSDDHNPQSRAFQRHKNRGVRFGFSPEAEIDEDDQQGGETSPRHMDSISVGAVSRSDHEKVVDLYVDTFGVMIGIWIFLPHRCMFPPIDGKALKGCWCFTARLKNDGRINEFSHHLLPLPLALMMPPPTFKF